MKIKEGFILREVSGSFIVVAVGEGTKTFNGMIQLNETGAFLWKLLESGATEEQMAEQMMKEYAVEKQVALCDVKEFIGSLKEANLIV
ncbi:MAG: PqqD family protein [Clostridia bacterium]|jgi:hypothetical protein|nr:PqqD family protein [Clostridia bacterium]